MELQVYQLNGTTTGRTVQLDADVFGIAPNDHVLWLDVRRIQTQSRQGTHMTKDRGEVAGSTRKLYRQKGTGGARGGSAKSPLRRTGGTAFGPRPRNYGFKVNTKTRRLARCSALSYKAQGNNVRIVEAFSFDQPSTQRLVGVLKALGLSDKKVLVLTANHEHSLHRSGTNLPKLHVCEARNASTLDLLKAQVVVFEEGALDVLKESLGKA